MDTSLVVYCVDVGSIPKGKFGWARVHDDDDPLVGTDIEVLATRIGNDLRTAPIALGFECPLFVPLHSRSSDVLCCRPGEKDRSWSASAGISSLGAGLVESTWLLKTVVSKSGVVPVFLSAAQFRIARRGLLLWEAFVTGKRTSTHEQDALAAAKSFRSTWPDLHDVMPCDGLPVMSLIGMAAIRAGLSKDVTLLKQKPVVIQPQ